MVVRTEDALEDEIGLGISEDGRGSHERSLQVQERGVQYLAIMILIDSFREEFAPWERFMGRVFAKNHQWRRAH
jgi:hypothetical protein